MYSYSRVRIPQWSNTLLFFSSLLVLFSRSTLFRQDNRPIIHNIRCPSYFHIPFLSFFALFLSQGPLVEPSIITCSHMFLFFAQDSAVLSFPSVLTSNKSCSLLFFGLKPPQVEQPEKSPQGKNNDCYNISSLVFVSSEAKPIKAERARRSSSHLFWHDSCWILPTGASVRLL